MPSDWHNLITAKAKGLNFSLFDVAAAREVPFGIPQCVAFIRELPVSSFVFHSSLLTVKSVDWVIAGDGFLCVAEIVLLFIVVALITKVLLDSYCCVTNQTYTSVSEDSSTTVFS